MKIVLFILLIFIAILNESVRTATILLVSLCWFIYTIVYSIKLYKKRDKKIQSKNMLLEPPNNKHSSHIRYLYKGNVDYKVFVSTIIELLLKKSISLVRYNKNDYYLVDNNLKEEVLTKNEEFVKKMLFKHIGNNDRVFLNDFDKICKSNSGYLKYLYKEWQTVFECECAQNKYFKSIKKDVDNSMTYFCISFIIALYNVVFSKQFLIAIIIFIVMSFIIKYVNDYKHKEEDAKVEYKKWLEFKNYIAKSDNTMDELDILSLENYATYAYVIDSYKEFQEVLYRKYSKNPNCFDDSVILAIMNLGIFEIIEKEFYIGINMFTIKSLSRNKGRRV